MVFEPFGNTDRGIWHIDVGSRLFLRPLNSPLDLANVFEIVVHAGSILWSEIRFQITDFLLERIENTGVRPHLLSPLRRRARPAEHPLEYHPRIDLHGQRFGGSFPR